LKIPSLNFFQKNSNLGMPGFDNLYSQNMQAEHGIGLTNPCAKIISANLFSKAKQAFASAFAPTYASAIA
jgi:hypothetical protein